MLQQMFEVMFTRFHAAMQTFAPLIDSVVDHCRWLAPKPTTLNGRNVTPAEIE